MNKYVTIIISAGILMVIIISALFISGCINHKSAVDNTEITAGFADLSPDEHLMINCSEVFVPWSAEELLITNGSYVAEMALKEKKAEQIIKAGGNIRSVDFIITPCPKYPAFCLSSYPRLIIDYSGLTFFVSVNESSGEVIGDGIIMPQDTDGYSRAIFGGRHTSSTGQKSFWHRMRQISSSQIHVKEIISARNYRDMKIISQGQILD